MRCTGERRGEDRITTSHTNAAFRAAPCCSHSTTNNPGNTSPALPKTTFVNACAFSGGSGPTYTVRAPLCRAQMHKIRRRINDPDVPTTTIIVASRSPAGSGPSPAESRRRTQCAAAVARHRSNVQPRQALVDGAILDRRLRRTRPRSAPSPVRHACALSRFDPARSCRSSTFCVHKKEPVAKLHFQAAPAQCAPDSAAPSRLLHAAPSRTATHQRRVHAPTPQACTHPQRDARPTVHLPRETSATRSPR